MKKVPLYEIVRGLELTRLGLSMRALADADERAEMILWRLAEGLPQPYERLLYRATDYLRHRDRFLQRGWKRPLPHERSALEE
jgi:hypothetical protein